MCAPCLEEAVFLFKDSGKLEIKLRGAFGSGERRKFYWFGA